MVYATFKIRVFSGNSDTSRWLIGKKRGDQLTREDIANALQARTGGTDIWASDIEELKQVENEEEKRQVFTEIDKEHKIFI